MPVSTPRLETGGTDCLSARNAERNAPLASTLLLRQRSSCVNAPLTSTLLLRPAPVGNRDERHKARARLV
eukprot:144017-Prorocentrum_minimum.AAC.1